jgi:archaellum biogenesis ATPase FlaH
MHMKERLLDQKEDCCIAYVLTTAKRKRKNILIVDHVMSMQSRDSTITVTFFLQKPGSIAEIEPFSKACKGHP